MAYQIEQIVPANTVMIVVDMQNDFVAEGAKLRSAQAAAMAPKLSSTLDFCRERGIRIIYTAHVHRRDGSDMGLYDDLYAPIAEEVVVPERFGLVPGATFTADDYRTPLMPMARLFADMVRAIRNGGDGAPSFAQACHVQQIVEGIHQSLQTRSWVRMREVR